jgi:hypothetical protein
MLQELNKIAIIHLFMLGFEDELSNFRLSLTNPSKQADLLMVDIWKEKILLYKDMVIDPGTGISAVSQSWAKKHILGFSDEEIKLDIQQQRIERAVGEELKKTAEVIVKTGLFDTLDKLYGKKEGEPAGTPSEGGEAPPDLGGIGGEPGGSTPPPPPAPEGGAPAPVPENLNRDKKNLILESTLKDDYDFVDFNKNKDSMKEINETLEKLLK